MRYRGRVALLASLVTASVALAACASGDTSTAADDPSTTTSTTVYEGPVAATELVAGDCLTAIVIGAAERRELDHAQVVACDRPHELEVFVTFDLDADALRVDDLDVYPGPARVIAAADRGCDAALDDSSDHYGIIAVWPTRRSWAAGDRTVACAAFAWDGRVFRGRELR